MQIVWKLYARMSGCLSLGLPVEWMPGGSTLQAIEGPLVTSMTSSAADRQADILVRPKPSPAAFSSVHVSAFSFTPRISRTAMELSCILAVLGRRC